MVGAQPVEHGVEAQHVRMRAAAPVRPAGVADVAVHVPLQVGDGVLAQEHVDRRVDVIAHLRPAEVEHELVAEAELRGGRRSQHPVGMGAEEVAVRVDHLRLDPQPELHPRRPHPVDQGVEAVRVDGGVYRPVPEARGVVAAALEPAVVEHEPLRADGGGAVHEVGEHGGVLVEIDRLPGVVVDRPGLSAQARVLRAGAQVGVEGAGDAAQALDGKGADDGGARIALAGREPQFARHEQFAHRHEGAVVGERLDRQPVVAAPGEVEAVGLARLLARAGGEREHRREGVVRGAAAAVLAYPAPHAALHLPRLHLAGPAALQRQEPGEG